LWGGLVGLALGVFVIWSGYKLKIGGIHDPGSGFVVFYTGILMCLFALSIMVSAVTEGGPTVGSLWKARAGPSRWWSLGVCLYLPSV
jgi:putative tricarboxylic transport membrane protein